MPDPKVAESSYALVLRDADGESVLLTDGTWITWARLLVWPMPRIADVRRFATEAEALDVRGDWPPEVDIITRSVFFE